MNVSGRPCGYNMPVEYMQPGKGHAKLKLMYVRELISSLLETVEPKEVVLCRHPVFRRRHLWAAGVNDVFGP